MTHHRCCLSFLLLTLALACGPSPAAPAPNAASDSTTPRRGGTLNHREVTDPVDYDVSYNTNPPNEDGVALGYERLLP